MSYGAQKGSLHLTMHKMLTAAYYAYARHTEFTSGFNCVVQPRSGISPRNPVFIVSIYIFHSIHSFIYIGETMLL